MRGPEVRFAPSADVGGRPDRGRPRGETPLSSSPLPRPGAQVFVDNQPTGGGLAENASAPPAPADLLATRHAGPLERVDDGRRRAGLSYPERVQRRVLVI